MQWCKTYKLKQGLRQTGAPGAQHKRPTHLSHKTNTHNHACTLLLPCTGSWPVLSTAHSVLTCAEPRCAYDCTYVGTKKVLVPLSTTESQAHARSCTQCADMHRSRTRIRLHAGNTCRHQESAAQHGRITGACACMQLHALHQTPCTTTKPPHLACGRPHKTDTTPTRPVVHLKRAPANCQQRTRQGFNTDQAPQHPNHSFTCTRES